MQMMKDNSIIYEPDFIILNNELLTSLCVYFDELILISNDNIDEELCKIADEKKPNYIEKSNYINASLNPLVKEGVITLYDTDEISSLCPKSCNIELGEIDIKGNDKECFLNIKSLSNNKISRAIIERLQTKKCTVGELIRLINVYTLSTEYNIPIIRDYVSSAGYNANNLSDMLAIKTLCKLGLPRINATKVEDILKVRNELKDELTEFRAGILDLTYLLYQSMKGTSQDIIDINKEMDMLIDTKIRSSVISLEHKLESNRKLRFPNVILNGGKLLLSGTLLLLGLGDTISTLNNSHTFLQSICEMENIKENSENKIASYIVSLNERIK